MEFVGFDFSSISLTIARLCFSRAASILLLKSSTASKTSKCSSEDCCLHAVLPDGPGSPDKISVLDMLSPRFSDTDQLKERYLRVTNVAMLRSLQDLCF